MRAPGLRVVTPEAVVLDVRTAGLGSRGIARVLDGLIQATVLFVVVVATASAPGGVAVLVVVLVSVTLILVAYPIVWEWLWRGRTPGKAALGLRVMTKEGAPIRFRHAVVRGVLGLLEVVLLPVAGVIAMLVSSDEQRLGDLAAGTIVVRERTAARAPMPVTFYPPPGWEQFVGSLDVSGVAPEDYEMVRAFLLRAAEMAPGPRADLAGRLAGPLAARSHQAVPQGVGSEMWLACVAAAYQQRRGGPWGQYQPLAYPSYPSGAPGLPTPGQQPPGPAPGPGPESGGGAFTPPA